jgi:hypothetical protein
MLKFPRTLRVVVLEQEGLRSSRQADLSLYVITAMRWDILGQCALNSRENRGVKCIVTVFS